MAKNQSQKASHTLPTQPRDARTPQSMNAALCDVTPNAGPRRLDPIQHIRDRTMKRQNQRFPRPESVANLSSSARYVPTFRKQSEPSPLHRGSRAPSELVRVMLDHTNPINPQPPSQALSNETTKWIEPPIDTPLSTGVAFNFRHSDVSPRTSVSRLTGNGSDVFDREVSQADQEMYDAEKLEIQGSFEHQLAAVWLGEMVAHAIIKYYQGKRSELVEGLTQATYMAQRYDLKDLMARSQLWKAMIFHDIGNTANIASILSDVFSLVRDFGDDMDCYQLRKLFPVYGHDIFRHLMVQAQAKQDPGSASGFNSPASRNAFEAWFKWQMSSLEKKYKHQDWPDPLVFRDATHISRKLMSSNPAFQNKIEIGVLVPPTKVAVKDSITSAADAALLERMMFLEDTLKEEREEHKFLLQEMSDELNRYRVIMDNLQGNVYLSGDRMTLADTRSKRIKSSRAFSTTISPGQVTAVNEILKMVRPRSRHTAQSYEREEIPPNAHSEEWSYVPNAVQIERWRQSHREHYSQASNQREPFSTPTHVQSIYDRNTTDSMASLVDSQMSYKAFDPVLRPPPLKIRNTDNFVSPTYSTQGRTKPRLKRTLDERRAESTPSQRRASRAVASANWRNSEGPALPNSTSSTTPDNPRIRGVNNVALSSFESDKSDVSQNLPTTVTHTPPQPSPRLDTSWNLHRTEVDQGTDQTAHDVTEVPSGPRLYPRRASMPSSALVSPITIDPCMELPLTDTPSPTKLQHTIAAFREHQEKCRRSTSASTSPTSISYETERRRSHAVASMMAHEKRVPSSGDASATNLKDAISNAETKRSQGDGQKSTGRTERSQSTPIGGTDLSNDSTSSTEPQDAFLSGSSEETPTSDDDSLWSSSNAVSNRLSLGKKGISVGHGAAITGISGDSSNLAQGSQLVFPPPNFDGAISLKSPEAEQDTDISAVEQTTSNPDQNLLASSRLVQQSVLSSTIDAELDTIPFNCTHYRQGSVPAIPSPLREASQADDFEDMVEKPEKQRSQEAQTGITQSGSDISRSHNVLGGEELVNIEESRQLSIRDFAYDQTSETSDLYGVSEKSSKVDGKGEALESSNSIAEITPSPLLSKPSHRAPTVSTNQDIEMASPVCLSKLYEQIENSYLSPIAANDISRSSSTADTWSSNNSVRMSAIPRLDLDCLLRQRQKDQEQALEDEATSPTSKPANGLKTQKSPKTNQDQREAMRQAMLDMASLADTMQEFQADWTADRDRELQKIREEQDAEEALSDEEIYGAFPDENADPDVILDDTDNQSEHPQAPHEREIQDVPPNTMEECLDEDAAIELTMEQAEERVTDGTLEFLLPTTYVPPYEPDVNQTESEVEAQEQREDMKKEMWSEGVI